MSKKNFSVVLIGLMLFLSGCNRNSTLSSNSFESSPSSSIDTNSSLESTQFNDFKNNVLNSHNYFIHVNSYLEGTPGDVYSDTFINLNNQAYYSNYYGNYSGIILQKNQGYIYFVQSEGSVVYNGFYATNYEIGISSLYDVVAENLFLADYRQDENDASLYYCVDQDVIAVASNFSGYIDSAWFIAPSEITAQIENEELIFSFTFQVAYIDSETGEETFENGYTTLTLYNLGLASNSVLENYITNPTQTFSNPTSWSSNDISLFNYYYKGNIIPFLPNASYTLSLKSKETYNGVDLLLTDYGCGNQIPAYTSLLTNVGFVQMGTNVNKYQLIEVDEEDQKTTIYTIEMVYVHPGEEYGQHTIGHYYPNGVFQALLSCRIMNNAVDSVQALNNYLIANDISNLIPLVPFGSECTSVANFDDRTANMNQLYGDGDDYFFYTSTSFIRFYISDYQLAKNAATNYIALLATFGYTEVTSSNGIKMIANTENNILYDSFVAITDFSYVNESSYLGYIQMRFNIYTPDDYNPGGDNYPRISVQSNAHLLSYSITDLNGTPLSSYDASIDGGFFYASFVVEEGFIVSSLSILEDSNASCIFDSSQGRWEIKPSAIALESVTLVLIIDNSGHLLKVDDQIIGASINLISPVEGYVLEGEQVRFTVSVNDAFTLESIFIVEDSSINIIKNPFGNNSYYFIMPNHSATISAHLSNENGSDITLSSISLFDMQTSFDLGDVYSFEGEVIAHYSDGSERNVTHLVTFSGYEMSEAGNQIVIVSYTEGGITRTASYNINVVDNNLPPINNELTGSYSLTTRIGGVDTTFTISFEEEGSGTFVRSSANGIYTIYFTYVKTNDTITITLSSGSDGFSNFGTYRPFASDMEGTTNATLILVSDNTLSITLYSVSGSGANIKIFYN
ncbi:MAG TPA: hypothetical protein PKC96_05580 [Bacilli bacterium]|nr:hypothetical protein [Bacilli bacterium]